MNDDDCAYSATICATIEIDDDVVQGMNANEVSAKKRGPWIRPPLRIEDVRVRCSDSLRIHDLSDEALTLLCSHLSLPSYGSLRNWDSVGIQLGIPDHEILSFRNDPRPMEAVLRKCRERPARDLIKALQLCKRVDLLYSLHKLQLLGNLVKPARQFVGLHSASASAASPSFDESAESISRKGKYILLIHYEDSSEEKRNFKWLRKNLIQHASQRGFRIVDIAELDIDVNLTSTVEDAFVRAHQIVVSFTPSHIDAVKSRSTVCRSVVYAHDLMNQEFFTMNSTNKRFRAVIFNDTQPSDLPVGWPRSTLVYHFPVNMSALCTKIFKQSDMDNTDTL